MGIFSKGIESMNDLFVHQLQDIYYAEQKIVKNLPKMIDLARDPQLKAGLSDHLKETKTHIERLKKVFEMHGETPRAVDCPAIDGILEEAEEVSGDIDNDRVVDAAIIASAQAVEHYEMARYGTLIAWARELGRDDCADVLEQTLKEEKAADRKLTKLAESGINAKAA